MESGNYSTSTNILITIHRRVRPEFQIKKTPIQNFNFKHFPSWLYSVNNRTNKSHNKAL